MININPSHNISSSKVLVYPSIPAELWYIDLSNNNIISALSNDILEDKSDDSGLYYRLKISIADAVESSINKFSIRYILFGCAPYQREAPDCSNMLIVYDMMGSNNRLVDPHICSKICYDSRLHRPPFKVMSQKNVSKLYEDNDHIVHSWRSEFPRPLLMRDFSCESFSYKLIDPYLQWSPPKFWHENDFMADIPSNLEI